MRRLLAVTIAVAAVFATTAPAAQADRLHRQGTTTLATGTLTGTATGSVTLTAPGFGTITCTSSTVKSAVTDNPGSAAGFSTGDDVEADPVGLTFAGCTDTIQFYVAPSSFSGTAQHIAGDHDLLALTITGATVSIFLDSTVIFLPDVTCGLTGSPSGPFDNLASRVAYTAAPLGGVSTNPPGCPASASFTGEYELVEDTSGDLVELAA